MSNWGVSTTEGISSGVRVFVSYSHDSPSHRSRVIELAQRLRDDGVDCRVDAFVVGHPDEGWPLWMERELGAADYILLVCSETYNRRFRGEEVAGKGLGATWEAQLTRDQIYEAQGRIIRFIPVFFDGASLADIPGILRHRCTHYELMGNYELLIRFLRNQPNVVPRPIGRRPELAPANAMVADHQGQDDAFAASIREHMARLNRHVEKLTEEQYRVILQLRGLRQVRVAGFAGSGKTLVAAEKSIRLAAAGLTTLFLCHNPLLAENVLQMTEGSGVNVQALGAWISALAGEVPPSKHSKWSNYDEPDTSTVERAFYAVIERGPHYDAIIVDEAQDFRDEWWAVVQAALTDPNTGILYLFHDDRQALLPYRSCYPVEQPVIDLSRNCRNAGRVYDVMRCIHPTAPCPEPELMELGEVNLKVYEPGKESGLVQDAVRWLYRKSGDSPFVVLVGDSTTFENSVLASARVALCELVRWQEEVKRNFKRVLNANDGREFGVLGGAEEKIPALLGRLSKEPFPTEEDIRLVRRMAGFFRVHSDIRRRIVSHPQFRNAMAWDTRDGRMRLWRPSNTRAPLWMSEIVLHFERADWHYGIPRPRTIRFRRHCDVGAEDVMPVYQIGEFKGLEASYVMLVLSGCTANVEQELYVGISRARLLLAALIDNRLAVELPTALRQFQ